MAPVSLLVDLLKDWQVEDTMFMSWFRRRLISPTKRNAAVSGFITSHPTDILGIRRSTSLISVSFGQP